LIDASVIFAAAFTVWAGVVGFAIRLFLSRFSDFEERLRQIEIRFAKATAKCD